jgi:GNAT superfamily N-acetyltransferase
MSALQIKKAKLDDLNWIANAQAAMAQETENLQLNQEQIVKGVSFIFANPARGFYVIAKHQHQPVGCLMILNEWSDWRNGDVWWIHSVYVLHAFRKIGVFKKMFEYVEVLAQNSGVRGLRLYVDKSNVTAQAVYEKLGMSKDHYELFEKMF